MRHAQNLKHTVRIIRDIKRFPRAKQNTACEINIPALRNQSRHMQHVGYSISFNAANHSPARAVLFLSDTEARVLP